MNKSPMMGFIGSIVLIGAYLILAALFTVPIPDQNKDMANTAIGAALMWAGFVVGFYFGSSKSSRDKDAAISAKAEGQA